MLQRLLPALFLIIPALHSSAQDSVTAVASRRYEHPSAGDKLFVGRNYREVWAMPVRAKVFRLKTSHGGFTVKELGGGMQTKSLHLDDAAGSPWVLRSLEKSVDKAMDASGIHNRQVRTLSQQMISAAQPYGPLSLPPMAKALGILSTEPELVFVPDDAAFGPYRAMFANSLCMLEQREPVFFEGDKVIGTEKMLRKMSDEPAAFRLDQKMLLQARLLDMLVADWDRHGDQWKWELHKEAGGKTHIYPIPRDHDQAYFNSTGLVFGATHLLGIHSFAGFREDLKLRPLNYKQWAFDKTMLKDLSEDDWRAGIRSFQEKLTDAVLIAGLRRMPREVYAAIGAETLSILRQRRDDMLRAGMRYYRFLQTHPEQVAKAEADMQRRGEKAKKIKDKKN